MKLWSAILLLAALAVPATAAAQRKPSRSMQVRSAELYLKSANETAVQSERVELLQKALGVLMEGAERDADNPLVWLMAGQAYARLGDVAGADSAFDRAERLYPEYAADIEPERLAVWINEYNSGIAAIQAGDPASAIARFESADRIYRGRPDAALTLGSVYAQTGDLARAEAAYRTAVEIARGPAAAGVAEADRERWLQQEEQAATRLADLQAQTGRADDAVATLRALVQSQPDNAAAQSGLAQTLVRAGKNDEAASIYEKLLARDDLSDVEFFNAGVGLYGAGNHALAVKAFQKSLAVNPYSRDSMYNLGQALYGQASELENQRKAAPETEKASFAAKLTPLYEQLLEVATRLREVDPQQPAALMMQAQAQRSLGELAGDAAVAKEWQQKVLATLEAAESMPFEVGPVDMRYGEEGVTVSGTVTNRSAQAGRSLALEFTLVGEGGEVVGSRTATVTVPAADERTRFEFEVRTDKTVLGWRYRVAA